MQISKAGIDLIKRFEGLRLESYQDQVGVWTIGYGHTRGVKKGHKITIQQAEDLLYSDIKEHEDLLNKELKLPVTQNQYDALVSILFNVGPGSDRRDGILRLRDGRPSTLMLMLNRGDYDGAQKQFGRWVYGDGRVIAGLVLRRAKEAKLFGTK